MPCLIFFRPSPSAELAQSEQSSKNAKSAGEERLHTCLSGRPDLRNLWPGKVFSIRPEAGGVPREVDAMAQFLILESSNSDGKPSQLFINVEQVCRAFALGTTGTLEAMEVYMSDGQRFILQAESASALFALLSHPRNAVDPDRLRRP